MTTTREKRFSEEEVSALIAAVQPVYSQLFGSLTNKVTSNEKEAMWQSITDSVTSVRADVVRTKEKIKEKECRRVANSLIFLDERNPTMHFSLYVKSRYIYSRGATA